MAHQYNNPPATASNVGEQFETFHWDKMALMEAKKKMFFMPMASVKNMPKHYGKELRIYHWIPLLDDRNVNDQGIDASGATIVDGNLYGSSRDIGTITSKIPTLTENGGRVNRIGFTRITRTGRITKYGFFTEFTQESLDFDTEEDVYAQMSRELVTGATQLTEAVLQADLLASAGVVIFAGAATSDATVTGEGATPSTLDYEDLMRLSSTLDDNRTPRQTTIISGSRMIDTRTIQAGRVMYIGNEMQLTVRTMVDTFGNPAFIPVSQYADASSVMNGEIGTIDQFKIILVPEMLHWAGAGANEGTNPGFHATGGKYDVFPMLVVGDGSFATIGFQTSGKSTKFKITTKMPGKATAHAYDPYGEVGFSSIKWYYGMITLRPERLAIYKCVARI